MNHKKKYRNNGAIGATLDEYEKSLTELIEVINDISSIQLAAIVNAETKDEDCRSVQAILTHVVQSGYTYVIEIRKWLGEEIEYRDKVFLNSIDSYKTALNNMFRFNEQLFEEYPNIKLVEYNSDKKIKARWGQIYDVEQLFEHAIGHVLRHRRQIEIFKLTLDNQ